LPWITVLCDTGFKITRVIADACFNITRVIAFYAFAITGLQRVAILLTYMPNHEAVCGFATATR